LGPSRGLALGTALPPAFGRVGCPLNTASTSGEVPGGRSEARSEEHTSELQSLTNLVCRLLLEKKENTSNATTPERLKPEQPPLAPGGPTGIGEKVRRSRWHRRPYTPRTLILPQYQRRVARAPA